MIALELFDVSVYDKKSLGKISPLALKQRLALAVKNKFAEEEEELDIKLRALTDLLVTESLKQKAWIKASKATPIRFPVPEGRDISVMKIGETAFVPVSGKMVVLLPRLSEGKEWISILDTLSRVSCSLKAVEEWLIDFSLVENLPFEALAYLVGMKLSSGSSRRVSLLWLREQCVDKGLLEVLNRNFHLFQRGMFLISRQDD